MEALETKEKIEETMEGHEQGPSRLRIGLLIAGLAALLALMETGGKSAQTEAVNANLQASNLWAFFQAKTARMTTIRTAAESASLTLLNELPPATKDAIQKQIDAGTPPPLAMKANPRLGRDAKNSQNEPCRPKPNVTANWPRITSLRLVRRRLSSPLCSPRQRSSRGSRSWCIWQAGWE